MLLSAGAPASDPTPAAEAKATIERLLIEPLADRDEQSSRFSRARIPPTRRTVRMLEADARRDAGGAKFFTFAIDERRGMKATTATEAMTGCVYPETSEVYVKRGEVHYPAAFLFGKTKEKAEPQVCRALARSAHI